MDLDLFSSIFQDSDFTTISLASSQKEVLDFFSFFLVQQECSSSLIESYLFSLEEFRQKYTTPKSKVYGVVTEIIELLEHSLRLYGFSTEIKEKSSNRSDQLKKQFKRLTQQLSQELSFSFDHSSLKFQKYSREILIRYILDERVGLGRKFQYYSTTHN